MQFILPLVFAFTLSAQHVFPTRGTQAAHTVGLAAVTTDGNGIDYHGGPVMLGTPTAYVIWYGDWTPASTAVSIVSNFLQSISGSPYEGINATYHDGAGVHVSGLVSLGAQVYDSYSLGATLTDANIQSIVAAHIGHDLPVDVNALYFVLTSGDIAESGPFGTFGGNYCGWHNAGSINGLPIKFSFVGDAASGSNLGHCAIQTASSPNGDPAADAMVSVIAHEIEEAITDPELNAWYDSTGAENADKCAWTFGATYPAANGSKANMNLGGLDYLIQQNWLNAKGGGCVLLDNSATWPTISVLSPAPSTVFQCDSTNHFTITGSVSAIDYLGNAVPQGSTGLYWQLGLSGTTADHSAGFGQGLLFYYSPYTLSEPCIIPYNGYVFYINSGSVTGRVVGFPNQASVSFTVKQYVAPPPPPPPPPPCTHKNPKACHG